jgi:DNA-binding phage protein
MASKKSRETFTPFDAADYLKSDADCIAYLDAALEEGDAELIALALSNVMRAIERAQRRKGHRAP